MGPGPGAGPNGAGPEGPGPGPGPMGPGPMGQGPGLGQMGPGLGPGPVDRANGPRARRGRAKWARANGSRAHGPGAGPWAHLARSPLFKKYCKIILLPSVCMKIDGNGSHGVKKQFKLGPGTKQTTKNIPNSNNENRVHFLWGLVSVA